MTSANEILRGVADIEELYRHPERAKVTIELVSETEGWVSLNGKRQTQFNPKKVGMKVLPPRRSMRPKPT